MSSSMSSVINMVNTAFGVTVLAVPYCFHQCGLILGILLLVTASYASKRSCCMLLRSAQLCRKNDFESLGFHIGGFMGKSIVEMSLIGYLGGTCIAWFVVIGDVAPAVLSSMLGIEKTWNLRMILIALIGLLAVLPLALVKDIKSLSSASNIAIGIYTIFVIQLFFSTLPKILSGEWLNIVNFWKPSGMLQCIPIFVISFLCQTVLFVIYESLYEPSINKMEKVVSTAMNTLLFLSITVGFCGYVMFCDVGIEGDLLNNYKHDFISEFIRLGFCVSTVLSFPLLIFPCRVSINSMISSAKFSALETTSPRGSYIPDDKFTQITLSLVVGSLIFGIVFPSVEFVMALVGATMGASLTYILPSYMFLKVTNKDVPKIEAKVLLLVGICLFSMSTFTVLNMSESQGVTTTLEQEALPNQEIFQKIADQRARNTTRSREQLFDGNKEKINKIVVQERDIKGIDSEEKLISPQKRSSVKDIVAKVKQDNIKLQENRILPLENPVKETINEKNGIRGVDTQGSAKTTVGNIIRKLQKRHNLPEKQGTENETGLLETVLEDKVDNTVPESQVKPASKEEIGQIVTQAKFLAEKNVWNESKNGVTSDIKQKNIVENNNEKRVNVVGNTIQSNHQPTSITDHDGDRKQGQITQKAVNISSKKEPKSKSHERELLSASLVQNGESKSNVSSMATKIQPGNSVETERKQSVSVKEKVSKNSGVSQTKENL